MLVDSDHYSTRLEARCKKPPPPTETARQKVMQRDLDAHFGMEADEEMKKAVVMDIVHCEEMERRVCQQSSGGRM
jgi:hypothetical protein